MDYDDKKNISSETFPADLDFNYSRDETIDIDFNSLPPTSSKSVNTSPRKSNENQSKSGGSSPSSFERKNGQRSQQMPRRKSQSYEVLSGGCRSKKYNHIPSKVKEYIDEMKRQDNNRRRSMPAIMKSQICGEDDLTNDPNSPDIIALKKKLMEADKLLKEKDNAIDELRRSCDAGARNLMETNCEKIRLERKMDQMRIELLHIREQSVPSVRYSSSRQIESSNYAVPTSSASSSSGQNLTASSSSMSQHLNLDPVNKYFEITNRCSTGKRINYIHLENSYSDQELNDADDADDAVSSPMVALPSSSSTTTKQPRKKKRIGRKIKKMANVFNCCTPCLRTRNFEPDSVYGQRVVQLAGDPNLMP